jgi:hypothetical protein
MSKFTIGDKVKVIVGNKVVILDDDDDWQEEGHEASLVFRMSELEEKDK